jgi:hypothetical protein
MNASAVTQVANGDKEFSRADLGWGGGGLSLAVVLVYFAVMALWIFRSGWLSVGIVACFLTLLAGGAAGSLGAGLYIELRQPNRSLFSDVLWRHVAHGLGVLVVAAADVLLALLPFSQFGTRLPLGYQILAPLTAVIGIGIGAVSAGLRTSVDQLDPDHPYGRLFPFAYPLWPDRELFGNNVRDQDRWPRLGILSALLGMAAGVILSLVAVLWSAYYANDESPSVSTKLPVIRTLSGPYVALGDSYSAGQGLRPFIQDTIADGCDESLTQAYPELLTFQGQAGPQLTFQACSGAIISDIFHPNKRGQPPVAPQVVDARHSGVRLVTITIGGNNLLFSTLVNECFTSANCLDEQFPPPGAPKYLNVPPGPFATRWAPAAIIAAANKDVILFRRLRMDFPGARIVVIGYPYLFPGQASQAGYWPLKFCNSFLRRYSLAERMGVRHLEDEATARVYEAAAVAGVDFVSPDAAFFEHEPCGHRGQFVNSLKPFLGFPVPIDGGSFHPNHAGQIVLAAVVSCYLNDYPRRANFLRPGAAPLTTLPPTLRWPSQLGLLPPPGFQTSLTGCAAW